VSVFNCEQVQVEEYRGENKGWEKEQEEPGTPACGDSSIDETKGNPKVADNNQLKSIHHSNLLIVFPKHIKSVKESQAWPKA
jgi:hypothetical protein